MEFKSNSRGIGTSGKNESEHKPTTSTAAAMDIKIFNFEKVGSKPLKTPHRKPENLIRRAGGLNKQKYLKYSDFEELYTFWCDYFRTLLERGGPPDERLLKADYHGALLRVNSALNASQVGLHGIVVHESKFTFQMVTRRSKVIVIPKEGTTFQFALDGKVFTLFGDALRQKSFLRGKKQRAHLALPFLLP